MKKNNIETEKLKYPIGKYIKPEPIEDTHIQEWIIEISLLPEKLKILTENLTEKELAMRYRPSGWTIQQVVHHIADSHMNSFIRFKLSLTEETPVIKPYFEDLWAQLPDSSGVRISESIKILEGLHARWTYLLKSLSNDELKKTFVHPERRRHITLEENIGLYAWHSNHHLAHIRLALGTQGEW